MNNVKQRATCGIFYVVIALAHTFLISCSSDSGSPPPALPSVNEAPTVTIVAPLPGATAVINEQILFIGTATDAEDGTVSANALMWESDINGVLGTGDRITVSTLALGDHNVTLTATDSSGESGSDSIFLRIADATAVPDKRVGEMNPYARKFNRLPEKLDDELILFRYSSATDTSFYEIVDDPISFYERTPSSDPIPPRQTHQVTGRIPVSADAGRILSTPWHQAAVISKSSAGGQQLLLEIIGLDDPGRDLMANYSFSVPFPSGEFASLVADVDAFNEKPGNSNSENDRYFDEVVLVYPDQIGGELRATIKVLSFETAEFPQNRVGPATTATTERTITTTQPMYAASTIVVRRGENVTFREVGPHIIVGYLNAQRQIAIDVFKYQHTRDDFNEPDPATDTRTLQHLLHQVISPALTVEAAMAGGWSIVVEAAGRLGIGSEGNPLSRDIIVAAYNESGQFVQDAWILEDRDGFNNPISLAGRQFFEFARVTPVNQPAIPFTILPNSKLRVTTGRITGDPLNNERCEAIGLIVLADTNRGPAVQSMKSFMPDIDLSTDAFGPTTAGPTWWPGYADTGNPINTSEVSNIYLASGGFISSRNGLIDDRGDPSGVGREFANDCDVVSTSPLLGQLPSFYVAQSDTNELHSITTSLGSTAGAGRVTTAPLNADVADTYLMLAADADGDAAYYRSLICLGNGGADCRRLFLGDAELHYAIVDIETSNVILQQPPKHIDYLQSLGGMTNVSMFDDYFAEFEQTDIASGNITRKGKTDWSIGEKVGVGIGVPALPGTEFSSVFDMSLDVEHRTVQENFNASEVSVSLTQTTGAVGDDVVWSKTQSIDYWRFPAQGGKPINGSASDGGFADDAFFEIAVPEEPATLIGAGTLNENYQPTHQVGNILSYPTFSGNVQDIGDLFDFLGSYVPTDENGTRQCKPVSDTDLNGCIAVINGALQRVAEVLAGQEFAGGQFQSITNPIDVAEILQIGGTSYRAELEFSEGVRNGQSVTNTDSIKAELDIKVPLSVPVQGVPIQFGELEAQLRASAAFENAEISENSMGSKTKIVLQIPAVIPTHRSYQIRPSFGFTPGGSLNLNFQVNTDGITQDFWNQHYQTPDPSLNMPFRIVRNSSGEYELGTDSTRGRIKGLFVRDGSDIDPLRPDDSVGRLLDTAPLAGDSVQLEVRVMNLSVGTAAENLAVEFSAQEYADGSLVGDPIRMDEALISYLPYRGQFDEEPNGHIQSAYVIWDTTGFGPLPGMSLRTWAIQIILDPANQISNETHELHDRFDDPLLGPTGDVLDSTLEKGQNNHGWSLVRIAPPLVDDSAMAKSASTNTGQVKIVAGYTSQLDDLRSQLSYVVDGSEFTELKGFVRQPINVSIGLHSELPVREYGVLRIFDRHPDQGGELIMTRNVQGLSGGAATFEHFVWRPKSSGLQILYATYSGGGTDQQIMIPIPARIF